jgi:hypothetical protein
MKVKKENSHSVLREFLEEVVTFPDDSPIFEKYDVKDLKIEIDP